MGNPEKIVEYRHPEKIKVMTVDDDPVFLKLLSHNIKKLYPSSEAHLFGDPVDALNFYRDNYNNIDIVILDMMLPNMNGLELSGKIENINKNERIILMTAYSLDSMITEKGANAVEFFLTKSQMDPSMKNFPILLDYYIQKILSIKETQSNRRKAEKMLKLKTDQQLATSKLGLIALSGMALDEVFKESVITISKTLDLEYTKILELLPDGKSLLLREGVGWKAGLIGHATVGAELDSQAGYTLKSDKPVVTKYLREESRFSSPQLLHDHEVISGMSVIIHGRYKPFGVLGANTSREKTFTEDDINFLQSIANVLAETIERKLAEEERQKMEEKLRHTQKLESLGVLAGGIAHDFNNILTGILGNSELVLDDLSPESPLRNHIKEIRKGAERAAELSQQMLAYSGQGKFVIKNIDINELIKEITYLLNVSISKKHIIKFNLTENLLSVDVDITQIRQVIMNLIINASEAIDENSGMISITTGAKECDKDCFKKMYLHEELPEGLYNFIEVADTGAGMDEETVKKIFDPFFTTKFTGRGLGMSAVLGIVRGHKGAINVESEQGEGTKFTVLLPTSTASSTTKPDREKTAASWRGNGTVLVVDDDQSVRDVGKNMLEKIGFNVITAADGQEAVEIFRSRADEINCVLLDLTMPRLSGEESFHELRKIRKDIRVIIYSGYSEEATIQRFINQGVSEFLQKPFNLITLKNKMRKVFESN